MAKYALLIGNSQYEHFSKLTAPDSDVNELEKILSDRRIGAFDNVITLKNLSTEPMRRAIGSFFLEKRNREDLILLYFSGHGEIDDEGKPYLIASNSEKENLFYTGIDKDFLFKAMNRSLSRRRIIILDCCYSGAFDPSAKGTPSKFQDAFDIQGHGFALLAASSPRELSWEANKYIEGVNNSLFTHFLIEGLKTGLAARNTDGVITIDEIYQYAYEQVTYYNNEQRPNRINKLEGNIVVALNPAKSFGKIDGWIMSNLEDPEPRVREIGLERLNNLLNQGDPIQIGIVLVELNKIASRDSSEDIREKAKKYIEGHKITAQKISEIESLISKQLWMSAQDLLLELIKLNSKHPKLDNLKHTIDQGRENYHFRARTVVDILHKIANLFTEPELENLGLENQIDNLRMSIKDLEEHVFSIVFIGNYKTGKSTLINALLSARYAPTGVLPKTATVNRYVWGETEKIKIHKVGIKQPEEITNDDFINNYHTHGNENDKFQDIRYIQKEIPVLLLKNGMALVDTPAFGGEILPRKMKIRDASAIVFVLSAVRYFGEQERYIINNNIAHENKKNIFFVINEMNKLDVDDLNELQKYVKTTLSNAVFDEKTDESDNDWYSRRVFFLDTLSVLNGRMAGDIDSNQPFLSDFYRFERELIDFVENECVNNYFNYLFSIIQIPIKDVRARILVMLEFLQTEKERMLNFLHTLKFLAENDKTKETKEIEDKISLLEKQTLRLNLLCHTLDAYLEQAQQVLMMSRNT